MNFPSIEGDKDRLQLYQQFAENRQRSAFRRVAPLAFSMCASSPLVLALAVNPSGLNEFVKNYPFVLAAVDVALSASGIAALVQYLDITRIGSTNGRIAQRIAQVEGRSPVTIGNWNIKQNIMKN